MKGGQWTWGGQACCTWHPMPLVVSRYQLSSLCCQRGRRAVTCQVEQTVPARDRRPGGCVGTASESPVGGQRASALFLPSP